MTILPRRCYTKPAARESFFEVCAGTYFVDGSGGKDSARVHNSPHDRNIAALHEVQDVWEEMTTAPPEVTKPRRMPLNIGG